jgi:hypothetical protein
MPCCWRLSIPGAEERGSRGEGEQGRGGAGERRRIFCPMLNKLTI